MAICSISLGNFCADIVDFDALETEDEELQPSCSADAPPPLVDFVDFGDDEICLHETGTTDQVHPEAFQGKLSISIL